MMDLMDCLPSLENFLFLIAYDTPITDPVCICGASD